MKKITFALFFTCMCSLLYAQTELRCNYEDLEVFNEFSKTNKGKTITETAKFFFGTPYVAHTLEGETEKLTVNLREMDCTTFLENIVTLTIIRKQNKNDFFSFVHQLKNLRYREGKVDGYASRIHYFSDWIVTNQAKDIIQDITKEIGGDLYEKTINFMSENRNKYPQLADAKTFEKIKLSEKNLNKQELYYIPKNRVEQIENQIADGDLIAITCSVKGLDIAHVGFAIKKEGRVYFMHASSVLKKVVISQEPLHNYLEKIKSNTGIMVLRLN